MKWPPRWLLGSPRDSSGTAGAPPASDPPRAGQAEPAPSPAGWAFLPPLQRTIGAAPSTTRPTSFPLTLPAWGNPSFTGRMTHAVTDAAPSGVIDGDGGGIGTPTERAPSFELPLAPPAPAPPSAPRVQRSPAGGAPAPLATRAPAPDAPTLTSAGRSAAPVLTVAAEPADAVAPDAPLPELPLPDLPLAAASAPEPAPARDAPAELLGIDNGGATFVDVPRAAASAPSAPAVAPAPAADAPAQPLALQRSAVPAESVEPTRSRRGGLGAPLSPDAAGAAVQRSTVEGPPRRMPLAKPAPQAAPDRPTLQPSFQPGMPSPARAAEPAPTEPDAPPAVQRSADVLPTATPEPPRAAADAALSLPGRPAADRTAGQPADAPEPSITTAPLLGEVPAAPDPLPTPAAPAAGAPAVAQPLARPAASLQRTGTDAAVPLESATADPPALSVDSASVIPDEPVALPDAGLPLAAPVPGTTGEEPVLGERTTATTDAQPAVSAEAAAAAVQVDAPATAPRPALPVAMPMIQRSTTLLGERPVQRMVTPDLLPPPAAPTPRATAAAAAVRPAVRATYLDPTQDLPVVHDSITTATAYHDAEGAPGGSSNTPSGQAAPAAVQRAAHPASSAPDGPLPRSGRAVQRAAVTPVSASPAGPGSVQASMPTAVSPGPPAPAHGSRGAVIPDRSGPADPVLALPVQRAVQIDEISTTPATDTAAPGGPTTAAATTTSAAQDTSTGSGPSSGDSAGAPAAPGGAGGAGGATSEDMDALARKLVEPLTRRLRAEMLIERERRGVRSDAR